MPATQIVVLLYESFALPLTAYFLKCGLQEGRFAERLRSLFHFLNGGRGV
jgi:hypothetical protein